MDSAMQQAFKQQSDNAVEKHMQQFKADLKAQRLNTEDMDNAEKAIICFVQRQSFQEEITSLKKRHSEEDKPIGQVRHCGSGWCLTSGWEAKSSGSSRGRKAPSNTAQGQSHLSVDYAPYPRKD